MTTTPQRLGYTVQAALETGAFPTRQKLYAAIARGDLETWKDGRTRMIGGASLRRYAARRAAEPLAGIGRKRIAKRRLEAPKGSEEKSQDEA